MNKLFARIKGCWYSLTVWVNAIAGSILFLLPDAQAQFPQLQGYIPDSTYKVGMGVLIAANIALRFKTKMDLADKGAK